MNTTLRMGVIGAGRIGKIHAENMATRVPGVVVAAIADPVLSAAQETAGRLHIPLAYADYHAILEDANIDAVAICSSTDTHAQIISEAALAGKHIFCEKPIAYDLGKIDRALEDVADAGVKLQIGFNPVSAKSARWSPKARSASCISCGSPAATRLRRQLNMCVCRGGCSLT
jgi:myo-inositol 2-dehydrogenase/D-chiro-inositol 1-dehydrogenase